jgi:hypothetical protein
MRKTLQELYIDLDKYKDFDEKNNSEKFLDTIDEIVSFQDPESIPIIIQYFDDDSEYGWVMESMSGVIEHFEPFQYVTNLLKNIQLFEEKALEWLSILFNRIFNDNSYLNLFRQNMHLAPKESLLKLFDLMQKESPHHRELIKELRSELEKQETKQH